MRMGSRVEGVGVGRGSRMEKKWGGGALWLRPVFRVKLERGGGVKEI